MSKFFTWALIAATLLITARSVSAQTPIDLRFNGEHTAVAAIGSVMEVSATTTPLVWGTIIFSMDPGPTTILGYTIPIGFDATTIIFENQLIGAAGSYQLFAPLLDDLSFEGSTYFAYMFTYDQTDPSGFGSSNQASVTFTRHVETGVDTAGYVDQPITIDGGAILSQGTLPPSLALNWSIINGPLGHNAQIAGNTSAFPTLTADLPGTYEVELSYGFPGTTGGATGSVFIDVFDLDVTSHVQGAFDTSDPINYAATLNGPTAANFAVAGGPTATGNTLAGSAAAAAVVTEVEFQITSAMGQKLGHTSSVINNMGGTLTTPPTDSLAINLKQPILVSLETGIEAALAQVDLSPALSNIPPIPLVGIPFTSATATIQSVTYDPNIDVAMTFIPGAINSQLTINNVVIVFDIAGTVFGFPFTDTGTYTATSIVVSVDLIPSIVGGMFVTTSANETATVNGAALSFSGSLNSSSGIILGLLTPVIEGTIVAVIGPLLPPLIDTALNSVPQSVDLAPQGTDITLSFVPSSISVAAGSMTLGYAAGAQANAVAPGAPMLSNFYETPSALPVFGPNVPGTTQPYIAAGSVGDDMLNQILAASTEAGSLEATIDQGFTVGGTMIPANAGSFALAFPGVGFDSFEASSPVRLSVHQNLSPIVTIDNIGGTSNYALHTSNSVIDVLVEVSPGYEVSALRLSASATTALTVNVNLVAGTLDLVPGASSALVRSVTSMPGVDVSGALSALSALVNSTLPSVLTPVTGIPLPSLTVGTMIPTIVGLSADGANGDYLSIFVN